MLPAVFNFFIAILFKILRKLLLLVKAELSAVVVTETLNLPLKFVERLLEVLVDRFHLQELLLEVVSSYF